MTTTKLSPFPTPSYPPTFHTITPFINTTTDSSSQLDFDDDSTVVSLHTAATFEHDFDAEVDTVCDALDGPALHGNICDTNDNYKCDYEFEPEPEYDDDIAD